MKYLYFKWMRIKYANNCFLLLQGKKKASNPKGYEAYQYV